MQNTFNHNLLYYVWWQVYSSHGFSSFFPLWGPEADLAEMHWNCFHARRINTLPFHQAIYWKGAFWVVALSNMSVAADHSVRRRHFDSRTSNKLKTKLHQCFHGISSENAPCGRLSLMCIDKSGLAVESCGGGCCTVRGAETIRVVSKGSLWV